jgi:hypothetical protein
VRKTRGEREGGGEGRVHRFVCGSVLSSQFIVSPEYGHHTLHPTPNILNEQPLKSE